jgi:hypothetical protein
LLAEEYYRELLASQRKRFQDYLNVLDKQKAVIEGGRADTILSHVALEEQCLTDIFAIQKVIDAEAEFDDRFIGVESLTAEIEGLRQEALTRSSENRELLAKRMGRVRAELSRLRANPFRGRRSIYNNPSAASLVDIKG